MRARTRRGEAGLNGLQFSGWYKFDTQALDPFDPIVRGQLFLLECALSIRHIVNLGKTDARNVHVQCARRSPSEDVRYSVRTRFRCEESLQGVGIENIITYVDAFSFWIFSHSP